MDYRTFREAARTYNLYMGEIDKLATKVRNGLFLASSRTYGEQYIEPLIRERYSLQDPDSSDHDARDKYGSKYEIKASKVLNQTNNGKGTKSVLDRIVFENENLVLNRIFPFSEHLKSDFLANIQNVKRDHFDSLIYVLLFSDCIKVFKADTTVIQKGIFASWSDKHGRYDELGKSGQFGITKSTIGWHLENHLFDTISYSEVTDIFVKLANQD